MADDTRTAGTTAGIESTVEGRRLASDGEAWRRWGPYLSERAWGTVREDYSADGEAWDSFPFDHARSRAYRWSEDGLAGICDDQQGLCFAFAFWNGVDPILKERIFGLTGSQGNHGEDAKEYWWYDDATPTGSWLRWRYVYAQAEFPYRRLVEENRGRSKQLGEFELADSGVFDDDAYWDLTVDYAKAGPEDLCIRLSVRNAGPAAATLHVVPTLWARNVWAWDDPAPPKPRLYADSGERIAAHDPRLGSWVLECDPGADTAADPVELLFCDNDTNLERLFGVPNEVAHPKDGIGDHVTGADWPGAGTVNPDREGTKAAYHLRLEVPAGETRTVRLRLRRPAATPMTDGHDTTMAQREAEADEFYAALAPGAPADEQQVLRQALAGMLWSKQFFHYDVDRWLRGDPTQPPPPEQRWSGRNAGWRHLNNHDVISMPDPWEYPWYAAWDLAFHCVALAHVDPEFAKGQLLLLLREWYMHPDGQLPAYEWNFSDVNPPVHGWAALRVYRITGSTDTEFLEQVLHKLLLNFTWWVNGKDVDGDNLFEGGFLGLDNIAPIDRSKPLPGGGRLEQADGSAWMASYALSLLEICLELARHRPVYEPLATKFFEHFAAIARAIDDQGIWHAEDGFYYDMIVAPTGERTPLRVRSTVGLIPLLAVSTIDAETLAALPEFAAHLRWFVEHRPEYADVVGHLSGAAAPGSSAEEPDEPGKRLLAVTDPDSLRRVLALMLDEGEFLSPYGLRSVSACHREHPFELRLDETTYAVDYEPAESTSGLFGGNSNWRGPIWMPTNYLLIEALRRFEAFLGPDFEVPDPAAGGRARSLTGVADDLVSRLLAIFVSDGDGRRPVFGDVAPLQGPWRARLLFHEYFHGDTGAGLGASHQTGWTGLIADLIVERHQRRG